MPFSIVEWVLHNKYSKMGVNKKVEIWVMISKF